MAGIVRAVRWGAFLPPASVAGAAGLSQYNRYSSILASTAMFSIASITSEQRNAQNIILREDKSD